MEIDINSLRSMVTVVSLLVFVGIVVWVYARKNTADFEQAARLPFEQD